MKKYITGGIAALITLAAVCMMSGQSQASSHQQSVEDAICHQQNQGVIVCPGCQGKGNIGGQKCQRCQGRGILKSNGMLCRSCKKQEDIHAREYLPAFKIVHFYSFATFGIYEQQAILCHLARQSTGRAI